ncbi:MAG: hypothetical protein RIN55_04640 [Tissierellaceae bacterium]|nr:hypothetical protein [Tissierellaceae bacterium]
MMNEKFLQEKINTFWRTFLKETNRDESTGYSDVFHFELTEKWANELLRLVLVGKKRATSSSLLNYPNNYPIFRHNL